MPRAIPEAQRPLITEAKRLMATFGDMEELIRLGAYRAGSSPEVDEAIRLEPAFEAFLKQGKDESTSLKAGYEKLRAILS